MLWRHCLKPRGGLRWSQLLLVAVCFRPWQTLLWSTARAAGRSLGNGKEGGNSFRVVTYNILSPTLCSWKRFPHCKPEDLQEPLRWERVVAKLDHAIASKPTVICLQEVDETWAGRLHSHFQSKDWHFAYAMTPMTYFKPIGVAMAWPKDLRLEDLRFLRVSEVLPQVAVPEESFWQRFKARLRSLVASSSPKPSAAGAAEPWSIAARKQNRVLAMRLEMPSGQHFVVANYHMPCLFDEAVNRQAKAIHCVLLREVLKNNFPDDPLVLVGDFNTKPEDSEMQLLKHGQLDAKDVAFPEAYEGLELADLHRVSKDWTLQSAYAQRWGHEPEFTNYAWVEDCPESFRATLDYILVSSQIEVVDVLELPDTKLGDPVYPTSEQPSDHVLLAADLKISDAEEPKK